MGLGLFSGIGSGINDILYNTSAGFSDYENAINDIKNKVESEWAKPEYDQTPLTPEEFKLLNLFSPEIASYVNQQKPNLVPVDANNEGTQAQKSALSQLERLSRTGTDAGMRAQLEEAQMSADQSLRSNKANALAALAQRGLGSSGATLDSDLALSLGAAEQQRKASLDAASQANQRKMQALSNLGNLGTQVAGQQQQAQEFNANTQNQYNTLMANRQQTYNEYVAGQRNQANLYNQQQMQDVHNKNVGQRNDFNKYNRNRQDTIAESLAQNQNNKLGALTGLQQNLANNKFSMAQEKEKAGARTAMTLAALTAYGATGGTLAPVAGAALGVNLANGGK